ncbi:SPW repeat protein [Streptomyces zaomyceticus]|uniref:SPW repeat protein n=1 Tax=Streptomyces zaomyceticus TaxID=68286 RepID=UPI003689830F
MPGTTSRRPRPRAQMVEALALITGPSLAASPWIVGFDGFTTPAVTNLITGVIAPLLARAAAPAAREDGTNRRDPGRRRPMPGTR